MTDLSDLDAASEALEEAEGIVADFATATTAAIHDLDARVTALEEGTTEPPIEPPVEVEHDFTHTPGDPTVGETVRFDVVDPIEGTLYSWDRTGDGIANGAGPSYSYAYQGEGEKTMHLMVGGEVVQTKTLQVSAGATPEPGPEPEPGDGVPSPTYAFSVHCNMTQGQDRNEYNSIWAGEEGGTYTFDRERDDNFAFAMISMFGENFPTGPHAGRFPPVDNDVTSEQGFWGRHLNMHNPSDEHDGWHTPPGNSSFAVDFIDGNLILNLDANGNQKHFQIKNRVPLGEPFSLVGRGVMGRNDGTTARPGSIEIAYNDEVVVEAFNLNTLWKWSDGTAQKKWWVWAGWYTEGIFDGKTCDLTFTYPWLGPDLKTAISKRPIAGPGTWNPNEIPITTTEPYSSSNRQGRHPGNKAPRDHSLGPGTVRMVTPSGDTSMLKIPAGWV